MKKEPLVVPPPPPRVIAPIPEPIDESVISDEPEPVPELPRRSRTQPRENPPRSEPKPPQQGTTPPEEEVKPPTPAPPITPAPELRTIDTLDPAEATQKVRDSMERAGRTLGQIDYGRLPKPSQLQYDMAKRFIEQSEEALRNKNFTAAQLMAEKAETIARELSGR